MLKNQSKTELDVKEMSKREPEQAEIYICNNYTNPDDTVAHLCSGFPGPKDKNSGQKTTSTNKFGKCIVESSSEIIVTKRNVQSGLTWNKEPQ